MTIDVVKAARATRYNGECAMDLYCRGEITAEEVEAFCGTWSCGVDSCIIAAAQKLTEEGEETP